MRGVSYCTTHQSTPYFNPTNSAPVFYTVSEWYISYMYLNRIVSTSVIMLGHLRREPSERKLFDDVYYMTGDVPLYPTVNLHNPKFQSYHYGFFIALECILST